MYIARDMNLAAANVLLHRSEFMRPPPILLHLLTYVLNARLLPGSLTYPHFFVRVKLTDQAQGDHGLKDYLFFNCNLVRLQCVCL